MVKVFLIPALMSCLLIISLNFLFPLPDRVEYSTIIRGSRNEVLHAYLTPDEKWRMKTSLDEISPVLRSTIIEKEDKYFYYHYGINPLAILRAAVNNMLQMKRTSGASTITMQVARALEPKSRNYLNKLREIFRAFQLEWKYSKEEILQLYCNLLPYGGNIEGVKSASLLYFGKDPDHLSLAQVTALCVIPNRPSTLVPGRNNEAIMRERNRWLLKFKAEGLFTEKQISDALSEPVNATRIPAPRHIPHLSRVLHKAAESEIKTAIDLNMQLKSEKLVHDYSKSLSGKNIRNAAVVVIDNSTHKVVTYIGSADFNDSTDGGQVDGVRAVRQPGSTLKPLVYGMCIDEGLLTPKAVITDVETNYEGYAPENYDRHFNGYVTMEYALENSLNMPAVKALRQLGKDRLVDMLAACHFSQIKKDRGKLGLSMVLGGCGATLLELTGLYSAFANGGEYHRPILSGSERTYAKSRILSKAATFMINETLSKISRPDFPLNWQATAHMPKIAWKTGTSYGRRDAWSIGYNKRFTVGVWLGNFSGQGIPELSGAEIATPLLFRIFNTIDYNSNESWYSQPSDCDIRMVCSETGLPPAERCEHMVTDYFIPTISTGRHCDNMQEIMVSPDERQSYCRVCAPATGYKKKWYRKIPAEMVNYFDEHRIAFQHIPPHNKNCEKIFREDGPLVLSPQAGAEYLVSKLNPQPLQLRCKTAGDVGRIYWYIDNKFFRSADAHAPQYFTPSEGRVKISCTDDKGRNKDLWITVKYVEL